MAKQHLRFQSGNTGIKPERLHQSVTRRTQRNTQRIRIHAAGSAKAASRSAWYWLESA